MITLRVIDFETTGQEPPAKVIEAAYCDLTQTESGWEVGRPASWLCGAESVPPETRAVHHISAADIAGKPPFSGENLRIKSAHCGAIVAHNIDFESKFMVDMRLPLICTYKAALRVWPDAPGHSNSVLRYWLEDQGLISLDHETAMPPHRAGPDAYVTAHILKALLALTTGKEMVAWTREPRLLPACPIGKFRGQPWAKVEQGFLGWMTNQADMDEDLKWNARRELDRRRAA
jgi:exodeoxyribonuclease X